MTRVAVADRDVGIARQEHAAVGQALQRREAAQRVIVGEGIVEEGALERRPDRSAGRRPRPRPPAARSGPRSELRLRQREHRAAGGLERPELGQRRRQDDLGIEPRGDRPWPRGRRDRRRGVASLPWAARALRASSQPPSAVPASRRKGTEPARAATRSALTDCATHLVASSSASAAACRAGADGGQVVARGGLHLLGRWRASRPPGPAWSRRRPWRPCGRPGRAPGCRWCPRRSAGCGRRADAGRRRSPR